MLGGEFRITESKPQNRRRTPEEIERISHLWARVPADGDPPRQHRRHHDALVHLATELGRRPGPNGDLDDVPRLIVAVDAAHSTLRQLAR